MENNIDIKFLTSLANFNLDNTNELKILSIKVIKSFYIFEVLQTGIKVLSEEIENKSFFSYFLLSYNINTEDIKCKKLNSKVIKICPNNNRTNPCIFLLYERSVETLMVNDLTIVKSYSFDFTVKNICLYELTNNYNIEAIIVSESNEIIYYNKGLILENSKTLCKENIATPITNIAYEHPYLIWVVDFTLKIFDLEKKLMIYRKCFRKDLNLIINTNINTSNNEDQENRKSQLNDNLKLEENKIVFTFKDNFITILVKDNFHFQIANVIKILDYSSSDYNEKKCLFEDMFYLNNLTSNMIIRKGEENKLIKYSKLKYDPDGEFIGIWMNNVKDKIFIMSKSELNIKLNIYSFSEKLFSFSFDCVFLDFKNLKFSFFEDTFTILLYDEIDIYNVALKDNKQKMIDDLKILNLNTINESSSNQSIIKDSSTDFNSENNEQKDTTTSKDSKNEINDKSINIQKNNSSNVISLKQYDSLNKKNNLCLNAVMKNISEFKVDEKLFSIKSLLFNLNGFILKSNSKKIEKCIGDYLNENRNDTTIIDMIFDQLIMTNQLCFCFNFVNIYASNLSKSMKEKTIIHLISIRNYEYLETFMVICKDYDIKINSKAISLEMSENENKTLNEKENLDDQNDGVVFYFKKTIQLLQKFKEKEKENLLKLINCYIYFCNLTKNYEEALRYYVILGFEEINNLRDQNSKVIYINKSIIKRLIAFVHSNKIEELLLLEDIRDILIYNFSNNQIYNLLKIVSSKTIVLKINVNIESYSKYYKVETKCDDTKLYFYLIVKSIFNNKNSLSQQLISKIIFDFEEIIFDSSLIINLIIKGLIDYDDEALIINVLNKIKNKNTSNSTNSSNLSNHNNSLNQINSSNQMNQLGTMNKESKYFGNSQNNINSNENNTINKAMEIIDYELILKEIVDKNFILLKIYLFKQLNMYQKSIEIMINSGKKIESAIYFIEDLDISMSDKQLLYDKVEELIKSKLEFTEIRKIYYISLFKEIVRF